MLTKPKEIKDKEYKLSQTQRLEILNDPYIQYAAIVECNKTGVQNLITDVGIQGRRRIRHLLNEVTSALLEDPESGDTDRVIQHDFKLIEQIKGNVLHKEEKECSIEELVMGIQDEEPNNDEAIRQRGKELKIPAYHNMSIDKLSAIIKKLETS